MMNHLQLYWHQPLLLLAALVAGGLVMFYHYRFGSRENSLRQFADAHLIPRLIKRPSGRNRRRPLTMLGWSMAIIALGGPYLSHQDQSETRSSLDMAVIIDISPSMTASDIPPSRLQRAKWELQDFVQRSRGNRIGLVVFSANAYVALPLTPDRTALRHFVDTLSPQLVQRHGSNLNRALELAGTLLQESKKGSRAIMLISDGDLHDPTLDGGLAALVKANIPVITMGSLRGAPVTDNTGQFIHYNGQPVISRLGQTQLEAIARTTGGIYLQTDDTGQHWRTVNAFLDSLDAQNRYAAKVVSHTELFPVLLLPALIIFLWQGMQQVRHAAVALVVLLMMPPGDGYASPLKEQQALEALQTNQLAEAAELYRTMEGYNGRLGSGVVAYRRQDYQRAMEDFGAAAGLAKTDQQKSRAAYNLGNALAQLNRYEDALAAYREALRWRSNFPRAALNLDLVTQLHQSTLKQQSESAPSQSAITRAPKEADVSQTPQGRFRTFASIKQPDTNTASEVRLDNTLDDTQTLLQRRFMARDQQDNIERRQEKPW
jgi:Ca-activated chloride channel family protein